MKIEEDMVAWVADMLTNGSTRRALPKGWHTPMVKTVGTAEDERRVVTAVHTVYGLQEWSAPTASAERFARRGRASSTFAPAEVRRGRKTNTSPFGTRGLRTY